MLLAGKTSVDLFDSTSVAQSPWDIEIGIQSDSLITLTFRPNMVGLWTITTTSTNSYEIIVTASCTYNLIADFKVLDVNTTHPNLRSLQGKPIASKLFT